MTPPASTSQRYFWIDLTRAAAAIMVIILHAGSPYLTRPGRFPEIQENIILYFESWVRVCVPLFFMISGFLFLKKEGSSLKKPLPKAIVPLLFYGSIAIVYNFLFKEIPIEKSINNLLFGKPFYHLWFFYTLIGIYIIFYFVKPRVLPGWRGAITVTAVMVLLGYGAESLLSQYAHRSSRIFMDGTFLNYLLYAFLGYYLATAPAFKRPAWHWLIAAIALNTLLITVLTQMATKSLGKYDPIFHLYQSPFVIVGSALTFLLFREIGSLLERSEIVRRVTSYIATYSLGIYGLHAFVLDYLRFSTPLSLFSQHAILHILMMSAITLLISLFLARVLAIFDTRGLIVTSQPRKIGRERQLKQST